MDFNRFPGPNSFKNSKQSRNHQNRPRNPFSVQNPRQGEYRTPNQNDWSQSKSTSNASHWSPLEPNSAESSSNQKWNEASTYVQRDQNQNVENFKNDGFRNNRNNFKISQKEWTGMKKQVDAIEKCFAMILPERAQWGKAVTILEQEEAKQKLSEFKRFCFNKKYRSQANGLEIENHPEFMKMKLEKQILENQVNQMRNDASHNANFGEAEDLTQNSSSSKSTEESTSKIQESENLKFGSESGPLVIDEVIDEVIEIPEIVEMRDQKLVKTVEVQSEPQDLVKVLAETSAKLEKLQEKENDRELTIKMQNLKRSLTQKSKTANDKNKKDLLEEYKSLCEGGLAYFKENYVKESESVESVQEGLSTST